VAWNDLGENVAISLKRGTRVTVTGRLEQRSWETSEGDKRSKIEIHAVDVSASLRYATVEVTKATRPSSDDQADAV
jgi:single-strand DNA-binding protein